MDVSALPEPGQEPGQEPAAEPEADVRLDLTDLAPPEPMVRILETLGGLPPGGRVTARLRRRPIFLYPRLMTMGCAHETRELGPGLVEILIRKPGGRTGMKP